MSTSLVAATNHSKSSHTDKGKNDMFFECLKQIRNWGDRAAIESFLRQTLPAVARHFDGKALDDLKHANPWLAVFEPRSVCGWEEAKSAFLDNGPACLDVLASFTDLIGLEAQIGNMLSRNITFSTQLLQAIRSETEHIASRDLNPQKVKAERLGSRDLDPQTVDRQMKLWSTELANETSEEDETYRILRARVETLLNNRSAAEEVNISNNINFSSEIVQYTYDWIFEWLFKKFGTDRSRNMRNLFRSYIAATVEDCKITKKMHVWINYKSKIQTFVRQVGCAKTHDEPSENIAELRLFHSTTIGYFAKLQDQYLKKELEVKKLRHYISALEFRYLLENLIPPCQPGTPWSDPNSGPRWMRFWEEALKDEDKNNFNQTANASDHALASIVDARNPKRGYSDKQTGARTIHKTGQNGQLYRTGNDLYGTLSDEIHRFQGKQYMIEDDDGWTKLVTDTLRALKPLKANMDAATGEVDWGAERKRYFL